MTTALTVYDIPGPFTSITALLADFLPVAADVAGNTFQCTGREILIVWNPAGGSTYTTTVTSVVDEKGRTGNITAYSQVTGKFSAFGVGLTNSPGWKSTAGLVTVTCSNAAVFLAVLRLPAGYPQ